ncbi:MAG TPA: HEAT repeat domain-containing protein [bacterium]|nr:HEAT repeat domain-containing protein [bacterium]HPN30993.1 HEAT repeat domain-containing protein [bacterium]
MKNLKIILISCVFFVIVFAASYYFFSNNKSPESLWNNGDKMAFEFEINLSATIAATVSQLESSSSENQINSTLKALLLMKIISVSDSSVIAKCLIDSYVQEKGGDTETVEFHNIPFIVVFHKNGQIAEIQTSELINPDKKLLIESLIFNAQFTYYPGKKSWTSVEKNYNDIYKVEYIIDERENILKKSILNYSQIGREHFISNAQPKINKAATIIKLPNKKSWFESIDSEINIDLYKDNKKVFKSSTILKAKYLKAPENHDFWKTTDSIDVIRMSLLSPFTETELTNKKKAEEILDKEQYTNSKLAEKNLELMKKQNIPFESLLYLYIEKLYGNKTSGQELKEIMDTLAGYLKQNPDECIKIIKIIRDNKLPDKGSGFLFLLLEKTGHKKAQEALLTILESSQSFTRLSQVRAAGALLGISNIQESVFDRLLALEQSGLISEVDGRNSTLLALGAFGKSSPNPDIKTKSANLIRSKLSSVQDAGDISNAVLLDAAANNANPDLIPHIEKFIFESKHEVVKHHAVLALTHIPEKEAKPVLMKILDSKDIYNIGSAVEVLKKRETFERKNSIDPEINKKLVELLPKTGDSFDVRKNIAEYLTLNKENHNMLLKIADNKNENIELRKVIYQNIPAGKPEIKRVDTSDGRGGRNKSRTY